MMPSSTTRLVDAISNAMAVTKLAPLLNSERANATAAYEQEDEAAPSPAARARVLGRSSPRCLVTSLLRTTDWITAARANPRISAQRISQVIDPARLSAWPSACKTLMRGRSQGHDRTRRPIASCASRTLA